MLREDLNMLRGLAFTSGAAALTTAMGCLGGRLARDEPAGLSSAKTPPESNDASAIGAGGGPENVGTSVGGPSSSVALPTSGANASAGVGVTDAAPQPPAPT